MKRVYACAVKCLQVDASRRHNNPPLDRQPHGDALSHFFLLVVGDRPNALEHSTGAPQARKVRKSSTRADHFHTICPSRWPTAAVQLVSRRRHRYDVDCVDWPSMPRALCHCFLAPTSAARADFARDLQERLGILALFALSAPFRMCKLLIPLLARETDPVSGHHILSDLAVASRNGPPAFYPLFARAVSSDCVNSAMKVSTAAIRLSSPACAYS